MVSASARREQLAYVCEQGISQRRACELLCIARSTLSYRAKRPAQDELLLGEIGQLVEQHHFMTYDQDIEDAKSGSGSL